MKKIFSISMAGILAVSSMGVLAGCSLFGGGIKIDKTKTQLYVGYVESGLGKAWADSLFAKFEKEYANVSFQEGKTGVQIVPHGSKTDYDARKLRGKMQGNGQDVLFVESFYPAELESELLDISDFVTQPLTEFGEDRSIEDKMTTQFINAHKEAKGKYIAIPWYESYYGIMYDVDMFERELLYFAPDGSFVQSLDDEKAYGPNGRTGIIDGIDYSFDDGLPATYDQYFELCDELVGRGLIPCIWSGQWVAETNKTVMGLHFDYEGAENSALNVSFNGVATNLIEVDKDGNVTKRDPVTITSENGYELANQAGVYYALKFAERLVANPDYYHWYSFSKAISHTGAQQEFLYSSYSSKKTPIAMILDGVWWENEADPVFNDMVNGGYGQKASRANRRFAFMPFPKATEEKVGENLTVANINSAIIVNGYIPKYKIELAKKFVQFAHTDVSMSEFSRLTSIMKPYDYKVSDEDYENMSYFGKSLSNVHDVADKVFLGSTNSVYKYNQAQLTMYDMYNTEIEKTPYATPFDLFYNMPEVTAETYFLNGLSDSTEQIWKSKFSRYF